MDKYRQIISDTVDRLLAVESLRQVGVNAGEDVALPSQIAVDEIIDLVRTIIFPGHFGHHITQRQNPLYWLGTTVDRLGQLLSEQVRAAFAMLDRQRGEVTDDARCEAVTEEFIAGLPLVREALAFDARAIYLGDPAAVSVDEVICSYPAIRAITNYRVANMLYRLGVPVLPRMICERAHRETGIDIHPGATIGKSFMIDHGTGVVIGETAIIGDNVKLYQGVTLGARSFPTDEGGNPVKGLARHPIIGDNVVIYANSTILGRITVGS
ncbi:MAG: serine acetyltransferase, partial [Muribaculaceae bacterium]|nr:serine acetyltransferase [Muribaculaceae bacterium]